MSAGNVMRFLQIWKLFWSVLRWKGERGERESLNNLKKPKFTIWNVRN